MIPKDEKNSLAAICGLFCGECAFYLAPRIEDVETLKRLADARGVAPSEITCDGCLSDNPRCDCIKCPHGFRNCAREHGVTRCHECAKFPCVRLTAFMHAHIMDGVSHHERVVRDLKRMREIGVTAWVDERTANSLCRCGRPLYWYQKKCPDCGRARKR